MDPQRIWKGIGDSYNQYSSNDHDLWMSAWM